MKIQQNYKRLWARAFADVMDKYIEVKATHGSLSCEGFYKGLQRQGGKSNSAAVRPSISDFICDVELAALRALNAADFLLFKSAYLDESEEITKEQKQFISIQVGRMLVERQIYPTQEYFKPKDI